MFKQVSIFKIKPTDFAFAESHLNDHRHSPLEGAATKIVGFIPPRGDHHPIYEEIDGAIIFSILIETKSVPASVVQKKLDEACESIEQACGRKPGKKERRDLKDEIVLSLLPTAFPKQTRVDVYIQDGFCYIGSTSASKVDDVITLLVKVIPGLIIEPLRTNVTPTKYMTNLLLDNDGEVALFSVGRELSLKAFDESSSTVRYSKHSLYGLDEIKNHIAQGKAPIALQLSSDDKDVSFVLTDSMQLKKIEIGDEIVLGSKAEKEDAFEATWWIVGNVLQGAIAELIVDLGFEAETEEEKQ